MFLALCRSAQPPSSNLRVSICDDAPRLPSDLRPWSQVYPSCRLQRCWPDCPAKFGKFSQVLSGAERSWVEGELWEMHGNAINAMRQCISFCWKLKCWPSCPVLGLACRRLRMRTMQLWRGCRRLLWWSRCLWEEDWADGNLYMLIRSEMSDSDQIL